MADIGAEQTDELLESLERRLAREYAQAYREVEKKAADYFVRFDAKDKAKKAEVEAGKITEAEYREWRRRQMATGKRWTDLRDQLAADLTRTNQMAAAMVRDELVEVFAINANYSQYMIENGMQINYGFTLYSAETVANLVKNDPDIIPWKPEVDVSADLRWNRQQITSHITQGILQGESIPNLSKRLMKTVNGNKVAAVRTARTAVTSSQNAGRQMVYDKAKAMGLKLQKEWLATLDGRTRHEHGAADGQRAPLDGKFDVGGHKMAYPGDMSAPAHLVYNCFVGETKVASNSNVVRSYKHLYEGDLIEVKTSCGVEFTCTPNHPILTPFGWVVANRLNEGDDILVTFSGYRDRLLRDCDIDHVHPSMEAFHNSFKRMRTACRDTSLSVNFHGDIATSDVEIITQKRLLRENGNASVGKCVNKFLLKFSDKSLLCEGSFVEHLGRIWQSTLGFIRRKCKPFSFFGRGVCHPNIHGCGTVANGNATLTEYTIDNLPAETVVRSELLDGLSGKIFVDKIISVKVISAKCHVYNLQTENGYYFVNSIIPQNARKDNGIFAISKNCRCTTITVEPPHIIKGEEPRKTYDEWIAEKGGKEYEQYQKAAAKTEAPKKPEFVPAKTIEEAEAYARERIFTGSWGAKVSYKGIDLDIANGINEALESATQSHGKILSGIEVVNPRTAKGLKALGGQADAMFATSSWNGIVYINKDIMRSGKTFAEHSAKADEAFQFVMRNKGKLSGRLADLADVYEKAGRSLVDDSIGGLITHEYGHCLAFSINPSREAVEQIRNGMASHIISGYSQSSVSEYLAECFVEYQRGDRSKLDPFVIKLFEGAK